MYDESCVRHYGDGDGEVDRRFLPPFPVRGRFRSREVSGDRTSPAPTLASEERTYKDTLLGDTNGTNLSDTIDSIDDAIGMSAADPMATATRAAEPSYL